MPHANLFAFNHQTIRNSLFSVVYDTIMTYVIQFVEFAHHKKSFIICLVFTASRLLPTLRTL
jgi:hypothetical protein